MIRITSILVLLTGLFSTTALASDYSTPSIVSFNEGWVDVVAKSADRFELVCSTLSPTNVRVAVYDAQGHRLHFDMEKQLSQFSRTYDFQNQPEGDYRFEVKLGELVFNKTITIVRSTKLSVFARALPESKKFWLQVPGAEDRNVWVTLTDRYGEVWFSESVRLSESGDRVFDLSQLPKEELELWVSDGGRQHEQTIKF
jgi:hypothetical protein